MKKIILLVIFLGMHSFVAGMVSKAQTQELLAFAFGATNRDFAREKRAVVLRYLSDASCLKQRLLNNEKEVLLVLNMFMNYVYQSDIKNNDEFDKLWNQGHASHEETKMLEWYMEDDQMKDAALWRYHCSSGEKNCYFRRFYYCKKVMFELGYNIADVIEDEYPLISDCANKIQQNREQIKKELAEIKKQQAEAAEKSKSQE